MDGIQSQYLSDEKSLKKHSSVESVHIANNFSTFKRDTLMNKNMSDFGSAKYLVHDGKQYHFLKFELDQPKSHHKRLQKASLAQSSQKQIPQNKDDSRSILPRKLVSLPVKYEETPIDQKKSKDEPKIQQSAQANTKTNI